MNCISFGRVAALVGGLGLASLARAAQPPEPAGAASQAAPAAADFSAWFKARPELASCAAEAAVEASGLKYLPCGKVGVVVVRQRDDHEFEVAGWVRNVGRAQSVFVRDGRVWIEIATTAARPIDELELELPGASPRTTSVSKGSPQAPPPTTPATTRGQPAAATVGRVIGAGTGEIVVGLGSAQGLRLGSNVELLERVADTTLGEKTIREERLAIGVVVAVSEHRARVRLGVNERIPLNALARPTTAEATARLLAPPRAGGLWEAKALIRPMLVLGQLGGGALTEGAIGYRADSGYHLELQVSPLGLAASGEEVLFSAAGAAIGAYDHALFSVGLGVGALTNAERGNENEPRTVLRILQRARLGALDGFHLLADTDFVLVNEQFEFGGLQAQMQIPLGRGTSLLLRGGGGAAGYAFGELGLRVLMRGDGGPGSVFMIPTLGGAQLMASRDCTPTGCTTVQFGGPTVGAGAEWRW